MIEPAEVDEEVEIEAPIFRTVGQALHVAYLIGSLPASAKSPLLVIIEDSYGREEPYEPPSLKGINFGNLSPLEVRGECSMITGIVERELEGLELDVILARYAHGEQRVEAMARVRDYVRPLIPEIAQKACTRIVAGMYCNKQQTRDLFSSYEIARTVGGVSASTIKRAKKEAKKIVFEVEVSAIGKLQSLFVAGGISGY